MSERNWLLAIDTSTDWAGIALTDGRDWAELNWSSGRHQTVQVLPEIERLLRRMGTSVSEVGAITVAIGPGSFSGLRVGLSLAKGFALAESIQLIGVSTLEATVYGWDPAGRVVGVIRAGRRRSVWAERTNLQQVRSVERKDLVAAIPSGSVVVGEVDDEVAADLAAAGHHLPADPARRRRAGTLAAIGWRRWQSDDVDDPAALEPVYIHPS